MKNAKLNLMVALVMAVGVPLAAGPDSGEDVVRMPALVVTPTPNSNESCGEIFTSGNGNTKMLKKCQEALKQRECSEFLDVENKCDKLKMDLSKKLQEIEGGGKKCMPKVDALNFDLNCEAFKNPEFPNEHEGAMEEMAGAFQTMQTVTKGQERRKSAMTRNQKTIEAGAGASKAASRRHFEGKGGVSGKGDSEGAASGGAFQASAEPAGKPSGDASKPSKSLKKELMPTTPPPSGAARDFDLDGISNQGDVVKELEKRGCSKEAKRMKGDIERGLYSGQIIHLPESGCNNSVTYKHSPR